VDRLVELDKEAVVQDYNSQRVLDFPHLREMPAEPLVWDCCAASGGKSILAYDTLPAIRLTVSDIRESILQNLEKRFRAAGITHYNRFVIDLSVPDPKPRKPVFDLILCDAPCTGSGTWSRTPEQMYFFKKEKLSHYAKLQMTIVANAAKSLKPGGYFLYITCSVFKMENEGVVDFIREHLPLQLLSATYFTGFDKKADTLFAALFRL
jgi:16S rRNA (cytosine967-C5)-methyltransferase